MERKGLFGSLSGIAVLAATLHAVAGETLYNGIVLPDEWPPRTVDIADRSPMKIPYLDASNIPVPIPIDLGRQLFTDDFLVESTSGVVRTFFKPVKYHGNPLLWPQTPHELALTTELGDRPYPKDRPILWRSTYKTAPGCYTPGGGIWWDPTRGMFRLWYLSGWSYRVSHAESRDALSWTRTPIRDDGSNIVRFHNDVDGKRVQREYHADTWAVWPDYRAENPYGSWKMYVSGGGNPGRGHQFVSADGLDWDYAVRAGHAGDSTTMFYNPFRGKWVWSLRSVWRGRSRNYHECDDFVKGATWSFPITSGRRTTGANPYFSKDCWTNTADCVSWLACDDADPKYKVQGKTLARELYNLDAAPYESIMVGFFKILCGPANQVSGAAGMPKATEIQFAFSRDGFHFDRPDRTAAIAPSGWGSGQWDSGYLAPAANGFVIIDEKLWFFYSAMRGNAAENDPPRCTIANGMHHNASIGAAVLRRDGFAGMVADGEGRVTTRPVKFSGSEFFVNADARFGSLSVEVLDASGNVHEGYGAEDCTGLVRVDSTKSRIAWKGGNLSRFSGKSVRFRFRLKVATLYAFWVSANETGESGGYLAGGGPAYRGLRDE